MKRLPMGWTRGVLLALTAASLTACGGVGNGNKPESATLVKYGNQISGTKVYTCFSESLQMLVTFTDGKVGSFTSRAKWTSSNPDVLYVSNAGNAVPAALLASGESGQFFQVSGILYPLKAGSATITAKAAGLTQSVTIEVKDPTDVKVRAAGYSAADATSVVLGPSTLQSLQLSAKLDGFAFDETAAASWEFVAPDTSVASFVTDSAGTTTNVVQTTANTGGATLRARPILRGCSSTGSVLNGIGLDLKVLPIKELTIKRELDAPENVDGSGQTTMALNTNEIMQVFGRFDTDNDGTADLTGQNLSSQVLADSTDEAILLPGLYGLPTAVLALSTGGTTDVPKEISDPQTVTFCVPTPLAAGATDTTRTCSDLNVTTGNFVTRQATLASFTISSPAGSNNNITELGTLQLRARGDFTAFAQDITRNVTWTSSDASVVSIGSTTGLAQSLKTTTGTVTITGTNANATTGTSHTLDLNVVAP